MIGSFQRRPPFPVMEAFLNRLGLCGKFSFSILSHRKLLINFMAEEDYIRVLCRKTWDVHGRIMRVTKWSPALSPEIYNPVVLVWISIPDLPIHLHDMRALRLILSHLGNPIMVDLSTKNFSRPALARVCVEMDVSNLPVPKKCRKLGHSAGKCGGVNWVPDPVSKQMNGDTTAKLVDTTAKLVDKGQREGKEHVKEDIWQTVHSRKHKSKKGRLWQGVRDAENRAILAQEKLEQEDSEVALLEANLANALLTQACKKEEIYWAQKANINWLKNGDASTKYFHSVPRAKRHSLKINSVKNMQGVNLTSEVDISNAAVEYFTNIFKFRPVGQLNQALEHIHTNITLDDNLSLTKIPNKEDIKSSIWKLYASSAAGPDGFNGTFFRHCWSTIHLHVTKVVQEYFIGVPIPQVFGSTTITLLPKKETYTSFDYYRPLSLSTFFSKIITRILSDRLKLLLHKLISKEQVAYQIGKDIEEHILLTKEMVHMLASGYRGSNIIIKLDLCKAFDTLSWEFLETILSKFGFTQHSLLLLMGILKGTWFSILVNGLPRGFFPMKSGVKQGDPLSPLLFIIAMEAIPMHTLLIQDLPKSVITSLNKMMANFLRGSRETKNKHHWRKWADLCYSLEEGGLGFRSIEDLQAAAALQMCTDQLGQVRDDSHGRCRHHRPQSILSYAFLVKEILEWAKVIITTGPLTKATKTWTINNQCFKKRLMANGMGNTIECIGTGVQRQGYVMQAYFDCVHFVHPPYQSAFLGQDYAAFDNDESYAPLGSSDDDELDEEVDGIPMDAEDEDNGDEDDD
ncbi:unnamed protein product [Cuscuta campestris]|uniref:Reverse transcriptase domain-containing protein n=1 Tax=Cuscuta campestris TaxID=132261 RepID=A0A484NQM3_9ASTE|nr:unnamed protein product [Cuscuta campestris]